MTSLLVQGPIPAGGLNVHCINTKACDAQRENTIEVHYYNYY